MAVDDATGKRRPVIEMLLEAGADPTVVSYDDKLQTSPLHLAISRNDDELLKVQFSPHTDGDIHRNAKGRITNQPEDFQVLTNRPDGC